MFPKSTLLAFAFAAATSAQQIGTSTAETHPTLTWSQCTSSGCTTESSGSVVLDANWRWLHTVGGYTNCYTGNEWDTTICTSAEVCAEQCALDGADYEGTYGITTSGDALTLKFVTQSSQKNVGSRVYLMADDTHYQMFNPLNQEFSFTVDVSQLPCGLNGALYFSQMDADGGLSKYSTNKAGAQYGTGYCDSQCPRDIKFINGVANLQNWTSTSTNSGTGSLGSCCSEMDVWEANSISAAYTPHPCSVNGQTECTGADCGGDYGRYAGVCDPDGCDFNSYRMGDTTFYGSGETVDTSQPFTVVTQFLTSDNTTTGTLSEIRRLYVQNGKVIQNSNTDISGLSTYNSITDDYCTAQKTAFGDTDSFSSHGGLAKMGDSFAAGVVLVLSVWDDYAAQMLWLDSDYPTTADASTPGVARGTCATTSGAPADVESSAANAQVIYSNIKFGDIGTTYSA
ncbi:glycoside hydrolase family 7 protein [Coniophora puteana RWD-64-598 SS2]|uniref:Glucanase n=1 Tax=Coniophora puteana (strain RWD-64-598) TaxID=741705 RepID=A0A5M3MC50_CONPW|nr:glycoside hydrolase family 7 protein [Coniophora puteana RWD-64-598 SS2]EIW76484.1 glycoside hydrolase family 7 protein [Coniophora puteana RWD-64-598 SS2]